MERFIPPLLFTTGSPAHQSLIRARWMAPLSSLEVIHTAEPSVQKLCPTRIRVIYMRKIYAMLLLIATIGVCSCKSNTKGDAAEEPQQEEIVYNDNIQNIFFGVPFGATKEEVINGFRQHGFYPNETYSTDHRLVFEKKETPHSYPSKWYSFGGMNWEHLNVHLSNNLFYKIEFMFAHKEKQDALSSFENVLNVISKKYHLREWASDSDTSIYRRFVGKTQYNLQVTLCCYGYNSIGGDRYIAVELSYTDLKFKSVSNEL